MITVSDRVIRHRYRGDTITVTMKSAQNKNTKDKRIGNISAEFVTVSSRIRDIAYTVAMACATIIVIAIYRVNGSEIKRIFFISTSSPCFAAALVLSEASL